MVVASVLMSMGMHDGIACNRLTATQIDAFRSGRWLATFDWFTCTKFLLRYDYDPRKCHDYWPPCHAGHTDGCSADAVGSTWNLV